MEHYIILRNVFLHNCNTYFFNLNFRKDSYGKNKFINLYLTYIKANVLICGFIAISYFISSLNCVKMHEKKILFLISACNCAKILTPIILSYIRYKNDYLNLKIKEIFKVK